MTVDNEPGSTIVMCKECGYAGLIPDHPLALERGAEMKTADTADRVSEALKRTYYESKTVQGVFANSVEFVDWVYNRWGDWLHSEEELERKFDGDTWEFIKSKMLNKKDFLEALLDNLPEPLDPNRESSMKTTSADEHGVRELLLYIAQDDELQNRIVNPLKERLTRKIEKGIFDLDRSISAWQNVVEKSTHKYMMDFGDPGEKVSNIFNRSTRTKVAEELAEAFKVEYDLGHDREREPAAIVEKEGAPEASDETLCSRCQHMKGIHDPDGCSGSTGVVEDPLECFCQGFVEEGASRTAADESIFNELVDKIENEIKNTESMSYFNVTQPLKEIGKLFGKDRLNQAIDQLGLEDYGIRKVSHVSELDSWLIRSNFTTVKQAGEGEVEVDPRTGKWFWFSIDPAQEGKEGFETEDEARADMAKFMQHVHGSRKQAAGGEEAARAVWEALDDAGRKEELEAIGVLKLETSKKDWIALPPVTRQRLTEKLEGVPKPVEEGKQYQIKRPDGFHVYTVTDIRGNLIEFMDEQEKKFTAPKETIEQGLAKGQVKEAYINQIAGEFCPQCKIPVQMVGREDNLLIMGCIACSYKTAEYDNEFKIQSDLADQKSLQKEVNKIDMLFMHDKKYATNPAAQKWLNDAEELLGQCEKAYWVNAVNEDPQGVAELVRKGLDIIEQMKRQSRGKTAEYEREREREQEYAVLNSTSSVLTKNPMANELIEDWESPQHGEPSLHSYLLIKTNKYTTPFVLVGSGKEYSSVGDHILLWDDGNGSTRFPFRDYRPGYQRPAARGEVIATAYGAEEIKTNFPPGRYKMMVMK
jgi:Zn ribbon nucleic-acid-binding protein